MQNVLSLPQVIQLLFHLPTQLALESLLEQEYQFDLIWILGAYSVNYFEALQTKLYQIHFTNVRVNLPDDLTKAFKYIAHVLDQMLELYQEINQQYEQLEQALQKSESECRNHIYIEQRLKNHCDQLLDQLTEQEKLNQVSTHKIESQEKQIQLLKREISTSKRKIEMSVSDSQDNRFLVVQGVPSKKSMKLKPRLLTESAVAQNRVRSISSLETIVHSIHMRKPEEKQKRSSTIQVSTIKRK